MILYYNLLSAMFMILYYNLLSAMFMILYYNLLSAMFMILYYNLLSAMFMILYYNLLSAMFMILYYNLLSAMFMHLYDSYALLQIWPLVGSLETNITNLKHNINKFGPFSVFDIMSVVYIFIRADNGYPLCSHTWVK